MAPKPGRCCAPVILSNKTRAECDLRPHPTLVIYRVSAMAAETSEPIFAFLCTEDYNKNTPQRRYVSVISALE